jgi:hypothetical protein
MSMWQWLSIRGVVRQAWFRDHERYNKPWRVSADRRLTVHAPRNRAIYELC